MGSNKLELNILLKRIELLEMQVKELKIMEPRSGTIKYFV